MAKGKSFILENNFENGSKEGIERIVNRDSYSPITIRLSGDYSVRYERYDKYVEN